MNFRINLGQQVDKLIKKIDDRWGTEYIPVYNGIVVGLNH